MKLYLVRHAEAIAHSPALDDAIRHLTAKGRGQFQKTARTMARREIDPDFILTSPLVRAVQTAEILAQVMEFRGELAVAPELAHGLDREGLAAVMERYRPAKRLVLVGHEPELGALAGELLGLERPTPLKKGAALCLKYNPATGAPATFGWLARGTSLIDAQEEWLQEQS
jgi:phosphohistidine phosphatase